MEIKNYNAYFFFLILVGISIVAFFIIKPFLVAILLASILAVIFQKPYNFFLKLTGKRASISALLTSLFGSILVIAMFGILLTLLANEGAFLYKEISSGAGTYQNYLDSVLKGTENSQLAHSLGINATVIRESILKTISQSSNWLLAFVQTIYQGVAQILFLLFIMFFSLYYFLIDGRDLIKKIMLLSPLRNSHEKLLIEKFISISRATIKGALVMGFMQGAIGGITFALVGVPSATIFAVFMMVFSLIPVVGSSIIWFPVGVIMLLTGNIWQGLVILGVGIGIISVADNMLRPKLVGRDTQMHPLMVLFATLGGLELFGFFGFIIGPVIVALFLTLWDIYAIEFKGQIKKYNA